MQNLFYDSPGFSITVWAQFRSLALCAGKLLAELQLTSLGISDRLEVLELESKIDWLKRIADEYLDKHDMPKTKKKWDYSVYDQTTYASSSKFEYGHLL